MVVSVAQCYRQEKEETFLNSGSTHKHTHRMILISGPLALLVQYQRHIFYINLLAPELFFLILAHPVYKMWIIQEPNMLELWNKLHFEEEKMESIHHV